MKTTLSIDQIVDEFLSEQSVSKNSLQTYRGYLQNFFMYCSKNKIDKRSLTVADLVSYRAHIIENYSGKYATSLITVVKIFFKWLEEKNYWQNVAQNIKRPKQRNEFLKEPLSQQETLLLLSSLDQTTFISRRDYLMIMLMLTSGLRCIEVSRIDFGDIVIKRGQRCLLLQRKGHISKDDFISIEHMFKQTIIEDYLNEIEFESNASPLFYSTSNNCKRKRLSASSIGSIINQHFIKSQIKRKELTPHSLRHTSAITLIKNGYSIDSIQMFLGHTKSEITKIYTQYANNEIKIDNKPSNFLMNHFKNISELK